MLGFNGGTIGIANKPFTGTKSNDPNYSNVSLLLNGNGTNGSTTFTDSSSNNHTITANGNAQISTAQSKFGGASMSFDGNGDYLSVTDETMNFGAGQFTIELWMRVSSTSDPEGMIVCGNVNAANSWQISGGGDLIFQPGTSTALSTTFPSLDTWHHVAVTRDASNVIRLFLNGTLEDSATHTNNFNSSNVRIGRNRLGANYYHGYLDDLRVTKGVARYTSNFTPPTAQLPGGETGTFASGLWTSSDHIKQIRNELWPPFVSSLVTNGLVLHLDAGDTNSYSGSGTTWYDLSGNEYNATLTNGPTYSSADGGSIVFDGSNDYGSLSSLNLSTLMNGSNNFSLSLWFNTDSFPASTISTVSPVLFWAGSRSIYFLFGDSAPANQFSVRVRHNSTWQSPVQNNSTLSTDTWYNMFVTYDSSSGYILYQNGTSVDTSSTTGSINSNTGNPQIGGFISSPYNRYYDGKISQTLLYNKVLTAAEVTQNFDVIKGRYGL